MLLVFCTAFLVAVPVQAFTANSLDITISKTGDATAIFRFTLEGILENAIPQSILEDELKKGLASSSDPPEIISMNKSAATLLMSKFADTGDVPEGTEYRTASMNFKKAEIALKNSALSSVITADFSPATITVTFPDAYTRQFTNVDVLPAFSHTVIDPTKSASASTLPTTGAARVISSPSGVRVYIDGSYAGDAPVTLDEIPAGIHTFRFEKDNFEPVTKTVNVTTGSTVQVSAILGYIPGTTATGTSPLPGFDGAPALIALACYAVCGHPGAEPRQVEERSGF
ncbi:PEGA domain-containing protein [Methanoregula sp.]|jgi:hypothetical protein|uniref:PEGA domain-containing protein n=1 Tax=Methanoregula sp. TaxID=2052170 RepID=UPI003D0B4C87